ncbi:uncharacterized protein LOC143137890 isoform X4 [Alosa pseudoharengus]|uniref:uncharacterized protein LOC143137890 isoform X4 n=1 Tax=Alosa pseudoharengus TaxID=34774 RepID=UPI003F8B390F
MADRQPRSFSSKTSKSPRFKSSSSASGPRPGGLLPTPTVQSSEKGPSLQKLKENVLDMLCEIPEGVNIAKFLSTYKRHYGRQLVLSNYGLAGFQDLITALGDQVCVERIEDRNVIRIAGVDHHQQNPFFDQDMESVRQDIIELVRGRPKGIPAKKLAVSYSQKYRRNLTLSTLGFSSLAKLLDSIAELVVQDDVVFHRSHRIKPHVTPPLAPTPPASITPPLPKTHAAPATAAALPGKDPQPAMRMAHPMFGTGPMPASAELTQEQLLVKVQEVVRHFPVAATSIIQLQNSYFLHFGTPLPMSLYLPLYNRLTQAPLAPAATASKPMEANGGAEPLSSLATPEGSRRVSPVAWAGPSSVSRVRDTPSPLRAASPLVKQPQEASLPDGLASGDFPPLGAAAAAKPSKAEERRLQAAAIRERDRDSSMAFHDAYHAQLRERHAANVRAAEALEAFEGGGSRERRSRKNMSATEVDSLAEDVIRSLATRGELVTVERVVSQVCEYLQIPSLQSMRIYHRDLPAVNNLQRAIKEVNMFIEAMNAVSAVCTLHELGQALAGLQNKKRFEELHLGPLCKNPLIHRMFKVDANTKDEDIQPIETVDILRTLQRATLTMHAFMDSARDRVQVELEQEVQEKLWKIKKSVMDPADGPLPLNSLTSSRELRKKYVGMTAADAVVEVFINSEGIFNATMTKRVQAFLSYVKDDRLAKNLFQLAICCGSLELPNDLPASGRTPQNDNKKKKKEEDDDSISVMAPSETSVLQLFQERVSKLCGVPTLGYLSDLEKKMAEHFKVKAFPGLAQGSFLEFLVKNSESLQQAVGGSILIGSTSSSVCGFRPSQQDVFEFITQCGDIDPARLKFIEASLRSHYGLRDSRELGYGPLTTLLNIVQRQRSLGGPLAPSVVRYEAPLMPKVTGERAVGESVGVLGDVRREQAVSCLLSAPLLEDLEQWSLWESVFLPSLGPLKEFIERHCAQTDLMALEVKPGVLLRVTRATGDKLFADAVQALDAVGTAGHLVSVVVADGILNAPTALLANHMESSLAAAVAREDSAQLEDGQSYSTVSQFVLECLVRIPTRICTALLQQIFLEPLSKVLGQSMSKTVLLERARSEPRYLNRLHQMGVLLGITEWARDYHSKLDPPKAPATLPHQQQSVVSNGLSAGVSEDGLSDRDDPTDEPSAPQLNGIDRSDSSSDSDKNDSDEELVSDQSSDLSPPEEIEETTAELTAGQLAETASAAASEVEEPDEQLEPSRLSLQRAVIEDIRRSDFGVGVELNEEGQRLMQVHQERLGRSLQRLSTELYSKDTHFVLELIQNADDNSYPSAEDVQPSLAFVLDKDCITILNNECGFQDKNVRAICDVGQSTKGKHTYGYIGQKGIGFKSVFKVTDCPEIHSNDFHVRFDKNSGPMGYILPHWVDEERPVTANAPEICHKSWTTKILLPLRSESLQTRNLFRDVHPSLLLFLHRLRSITIFNQTDGRLVTMSRQDLSHNILEVRHTGGLERWLVVKSRLHPKKIKEEVESTELAMAFCLSDGSSSSSTDAPLQPRQQNVFAFLPLRSFGFRFIIQGDFDIPSSREDVDRDSSWNQWLRSNLPQLFMEAMDVFSKHPEFRGLKGLCYFLQFVPLPDEIQDFFKPVANQILQLLKGQACLPAKEGRDGKVALKQPSELAVCPDPVVQEVVGAEELDKHLRLAYLHPLLQAQLPAALLATLGVRRLRGADVAAVTCAMARELVQNATPLSDGHMKTLARLLQCNYRAQEQEYGEAHASLQGLKDLPMIPLADGRLVTLSGGGVFFPINDVGETLKGLEALYRDLCTVAPALLTSLDALGNSQVRELLRRLGVHELEPQQVLRQHIYPALSSDTWKSKPQDVLVSYLLFIKQHVREQDYGSLNVAVPVLTNRGLLCPALSRVHFSKDYSNIDLPTKLPGVDWVMVDPCYLRADRDVVGWRELFMALGVRDLLIFRKERRTLSAQQLACSPWAEEASRWPKPAGGVYVLDDYQCEEFQGLATTEELLAPAKLEQRSALLNLLDQNWDTGEKYSQYLSAQVLDSEGRPLRDTHSSFLIALTRLPWVPTFRLGHDDQPTAPSYHCPGSVYLYSQDVHSVLGAHVDYVQMAPSEFSRGIGMRHTVSVDEVIDYLKRWSTQASADSAPAEGVGEEPQFTTTVQHISNVYGYLQTHCPPGQLRELFQHTPAVFVKYESMKNNWCSGKFYHLKEVCWNDPTGMFLRYKELVSRASNGLQEPKVLAPFYSSLTDMKSLFLGLGVERNPSMKQYVDLLELVCESESQATGLILQDVSIIYAKLAEKCIMGHSGDQDAAIPLNPSYCSSLREMLSGQRVFPSKRSSWVSLAQRPMIPDDKHLEKIFQSHPEVCLLNLPPAQKKAPTRPKPGTATAKQQRSEPTFSEEERSLFLDICGVPRLSESVSTEPQTVSYRPSPTLQALVREAVPYVQRFLCSHEEFAELYAELQESGIAQQIKSLSFGQVGELYIHYHLKVPDGEEVYEKEDVICLLKDRKELYIQKDYLKSKLDICRELVKLFSPEGSQADKLLTFLESLMSSIHDRGALKRFLDIKGIKELPTEEEPWEVPMPIDTRPEPSAPRPVSRQEEERKTPAAAGEEDGLVCWPPKSGLSDGRGAAGRPRGTDAAVEAVMKMWPPPNAPSSSAEYTGTLPPMTERSPRGGPPSGEPQSPQSPLPEGTSLPTGTRFSGSHTQGPGKAFPGEAGAQSAVGGVQSSPSEAAPCQPGVGGGGGGGGGAGSGGSNTGGSGEPREDDSISTTTTSSNSSRASYTHTTPRDQQAIPSTQHNTIPGEAPEVISSQFQGVGHLQRVPLALDTAVWAQALGGEAALQDLVLDCPLPRTMVEISDDPGDFQDVGLWGEQLVHSFLSKWQAHGPAGPTEVTWYNRDGETGQPCDFKLTFGPDGDGGSAKVVYVEVKTTTKPDRHLVRLSANELDFALKEKERYHIYRVYGAGDAQNARLVRIQNLAQHLHSKTLELFLFV